MYTAEMVNRIRQHDIIHLDEVLKPDKDTIEKSISLELSKKVSVQCQ